MKTKNTQEGLSIIAAIIILAVIGVGGYALYNAADKNNTESDEYESIQEQVDAEVAVEISADAKSTLAKVRTQLALNTQAGVQVAIETLNEFEQRIRSGANRASEDVQEEFNELGQDILDLNARLSSAAESESILNIDSIAVTIDDLEEDFIEVLIDIQDEVGIEIVMEGEGHNNTMILEESDENLAENDESEIMVESEDDDMLLNEVPEPNTETEIEIVVE